MALAAELLRDRGEDFRIGIGERIDVVQWDPEPSRFVANALSPAQVVSVDTREDENTAEVVVPDRQLSLAM